MFIAKLQGGLGNQLFQYALGRHLAEKNHTELKLDTFWYGSVPDRQYDLHHFTITATLATPGEIRKLKGVLPDPLTRRLNIKRRTVISEPSPLFHGEILETPPPAYLEGYWQSEKYFREIAPIIKEEFTLKTPPTGLNKSLLEEIRKTAAVSIHVRRGDYVSNQVANQFHGTCSPAYYEQAARLIAEKVKSPHFYVFSDDPEWTKTNITFDHPATYISHNGAAAQEDLRLMSACQHFVVANSTFSWWGAWLATAPGKMVIAPQQWFQGGRDSSDLVPAEWIRI